MATPPVPRWEVLPTEALEAIFRHLGVIQLGQMRLMCRHWNAAVCRSPALISKFVVRFGEKADLLLTNNSEMAELLSGRFNKVFIDVKNVGMVARSPLWAKLGPSIRSMTVDSGSCEDLDVAELLELLRKVPGLVRLQMEIQGSGIDFSVTEADFKLEQLEELTLTATDTEWLGLFSGICSKLKVFKCYDSWGLRESFSVDDMMAFILAHEGTLQKITIWDHSVERWLKIITSANKLKLKALSLAESPFQSSRTVHAEDFILLCKTFPTLQSLKLKYNYLKTTVLKDFQANLGQLRTFCIRIYKPTEYNSLKKLLSKMPQLEYLSVEFITRQGTWLPGNNLDLRGVSCANLKKLKITCFTFSREGLADFFKNSPKIKHLKLRHFQASNKVDFIQTLSLMKSLEILNIEQYPFSKPDVGGFKLNSVRDLCSSSVRLTDCCPALETVRLRQSSRGCHVITDNDVFDLLRGLPNLRHLFIEKFNTENALTDDVLDFLAIEGRRLETLQLELLPEITSEAARVRLTEALKNIVDFRYRLDRDDDDDDESETDMGIN